MGSAGSAPEPTCLYQRLADGLSRSRKIGGLGSVETAFVFSHALSRLPGPQLLICKDNRKAEALVSDLDLFLKPEEGALLIPGMESDPYRGLSPHPEISEQRAVGLWKLTQGFDGLVVTTAASLLTKLVPPADFLSHCLTLEISSFLPRDHLITTLRSMGYVREDPVSQLGEFSFRGGIVDLFSPSGRHPVRLEFFGDEIESIREFDPSTQRSIRLISACQIVPMREMVPTDADIARWHDRAPKHWNEVRFAEDLGEKLQFTENRELFNGFEFLMPLALTTGASIFDYFSTEKTVQVNLLEVSELKTGLRKFFQSLEDGYQDCSLEGTLALRPEVLFFSREWCSHLFGQDHVRLVDRLQDDSEQFEHFDFRPPRKYRGRIRELLPDLKRWKDSGDHILFVMGSLGMAERLLDIFREYELAVPQLKESFQDSLKERLAATYGPLSGGFSSAELGLQVLTEDDLFGGVPSQPSARVSPHEAGTRFVSDFRDLREGDYLVHVDHGIGRFAGLKSIGVQQDPREFVVLVYQGESKLYVPVDRLDLIQKYSGGGDGSPTVDRLGGTSWTKTKARIKKSMRVLAEDLLKLYAAREVAQGYAFSGEDELTKEFDDAFEYQTTVDQQGAIRDVKADMQAARPMDRLICGDVGYGKTEVAMRAAFKAVNDSKQVILLAPTTVLALQHYKTFATRFRGFPVRVVMLSRFLSRKEQKEIVEKARQGLVDILIGTHRLLSKDVLLRDLGLIVVDEEQRFGVAQKEKLKRLKTRVDVLTLSATPIPRTLNMSLVGIRDLSLIETPPKDRMAIQTVVVKFGRRIVRTAIDLELKRNGQVFFVHNSIDSIYSIAKMIQEIVPEARVAVAHGQMREKQLEQVMLDFVDYRYDVLVCTTIIENGLDIPRANTLMVNRADRFGLSQLYQLRGRVGRSSRRAYAYLLIPTEETLSTEARRRLAAIREFSDLGSGFRIAALDLEIRGAGNMLGGEQHGHITAVGFELYLKLLGQAVRELKGEEPEEELRTSIDLRLDIQVPEHYIEDANLRIWLYKRISMAADAEQLASLKEEIIDRYGKYPRSVANLFEYSRLRQRAKQLRIIGLERKGDRVLLKFREDTPISPQRVISMIGQRPDIELTVDGGVSLQIRSSVPSQIFGQLNEALDALT